MTGAAHCIEEERKRLERQTGMAFEILSTTRRTVPSSAARKISSAQVSSVSASVHHVPPARRQITWNSFDQGYGCVRETEADEVLGIVVQKVLQ